MCFYFGGEFLISLIDSKVNFKNKKKKNFKNEKKIWLVDLNTVSKYFNNLLMWQLNHMLPLWSILFRVYYVTSSLPYLWLDLFFWLIKKNFTHVSVSKLSERKQTDLKQNKTKSQI